METIKLHFTRPVVALDPWDSIQQRLRLDADHCPTCCNLDYKVAEYMFALPDQNIFVSQTMAAAQQTVWAADIAASARDGCASCMLLRSCVEAMTKLTVDEDSEEEVCIIFRKSKALSIYLSSENGFLEVFTLADKSSPWPAVGNHIVYLDPQYDNSTWIGGSAGVVTVENFGESCFHQVRAWMERCKEQHPFCSPEFGRQGNAEERQAPARLLLIGDNITDIRLIDNDGPARSYVALSHCWGTSRHLLLTKDTVQQFKQTIAWDDLPQTFRDAIITTREVGINYIWIDSLCIIQDDAGDWEVEASKMAAVYADADLTVSADASKDSNGGCFAARSPTVKIDITDSENSACTIYCRRRISHRAFDFGVGDRFNLGARGLYLDDSKTNLRFPLFTRGWTLQERLLARRILHFGPDEMVFECLACMSCECGTLADFAGNPSLRERRYAAGVPLDVEIQTGKLSRGEDLVQKFADLGLGTESVNGLESAYRNDPALMLAMTRAQNTKGTGQRLLQSNPSAEYSSHHSWRDLIALYSKRRLTYATDALPALSGLARRWFAHEKRRPAYLAGIWEADLLRSLLWKCIGNDETPRPSLYIAPSWSWAAVRRPVDWLASGQRAKYHVQILEASCEPNGIDPFGKVASGRIVVRGIAVACFVKADQPGVAHLRSKDLVSQFLYDSWSECEELDGREVVYLRCCTDVNDVKKGLGFERGLVLCRNGDSTHKRIGVVGYGHTDISEWMEDGQIEDLVIV